MVLNGISRCTLRNVDMDYTKESLKQKLVEIHCEIKEKGLSLNIEFDEKYNSWAITFSKYIILGTPSSFKVLMSLHLRSWDSARDPYVVVKGSNRDLFTI